MADVAQSVILQSSHRLSRAVRAISAPDTELHRIFAFDHFHVLPYTSSGATSRRNMARRQLSLRYLLRVLEALVKIVILSKRVISLMRVLSDLENLVEGNLHVTDH